MHDFFGKKRITWLNSSTSKATLVLFDRPRISHRYRDPQTLNNLSETTCIICCLVRTFKFLFMTIFIGECFLFYI